MKTYGRVAGFHLDSVVDGPGIRNTVFLQGCPHKCPQCHNPSTWSGRGGELFTVDEVLNKLLANGVTAITISGGEPFTQPGFLYALLRALPQRTHVIIYTGYTWDVIQEFNYILKYVDIVIDGPYISTQREYGTFKGSRNQRYIDVQTSLRHNTVHALTNIS